jgi:hypothetical protein
MNKYLKLKKKYSNTESWYFINPSFIVGIEELNGGEFKVITVSGSYLVEPNEELLNLTKSSKQVLRG